MSTHSPEGPFASERVLDDVVDGYVSPALARSEYKCVIRKTQRTYSLDQSGTRSLRSSRAKRIETSSAKRNVRNEPKTGLAVSE